MADNDDDELSLVPANQLRRSQLTWQWPYRVPYDAVTLLEGRKGSGKSTVAAALAAHVTAGAKLPGAARSRSRRGVLWLGVEESAESIGVHRLKAAGCDLTKCFFLPEGRRLALPADAETLASLCESNGVGLLVVDPLSSLVPPGVSLGDEQSARAVMEGLARVTVKCHLAALVIRHLTKCRYNDQLDQGIGSVAIAAVARSVLRCGQHADESGVNALWVVASNLCALPPALKYEIREEGGSVYVGWLGESSLTGEEIADRADDAAERSAREEAARFLQLELKDGPKSVKDLMARAASCGITPRTLRRAKAELGIESSQRRQAGQTVWEWRLRKDAK